MPELRGTKDEAALKTKGKEGVRLALAQGQYLGEIRGNTLSRNCSEGSFLFFQSFSECLGLTRIILWNPCHDCDGITIPIYRGESGGEI